MAFDPSQVATSDPDTDVTLVAGNHEVPTGHPNDATIVRADSLGVRAEGHRRQLEGNLPAAHVGQPATHRANRGASHSRLLADRRAERGRQAAAGTPGWTERSTADAMGVDHQTVANIRHARELRPKLPAEVSDGLHDTKSYRIATVEQEFPAALATAAAEAGCLSAGSPKRRASTRRP